MRSPEADLSYLRHMLDAADRIGSYVGGVNRDDFEQSTLIQDAVIRQIQVLGEAAKKLTWELREREPQIPWRRITGMREKLVHDYMGIDLDAVWITATQDVPALREQIVAILDILAGSDGT